MSNTLEKHPGILHENRTFGEVLVQGGNGLESLDLSNAHDTIHRWSRIFQVKDPRTVATRPLLFQAWGRKPG